MASAGWLRTRHGGARSALVHVPTGGPGAACLAWLAVMVAMTGAVSEPCDPNQGLAEGCASTPVVQTSNGPVTGFLRQGAETTDVSVSTFWGLPFAEPPVGQNRLRAPQKLARKWKEPLKAVRKSKVCHQYFLSVRHNHTHRDGAHEDCLYLNVYAPAAALGSTAKIPVMVWLYGGAYVMGDAYNTMDRMIGYDGAALAGRHNVIVVVGNYRVAGLGFFASDALLEEDEEHSTGNMALRDQRAGMEWVQENIANFGGDPTRVTLFGESAGAFSVMWHLVSRNSRTLFHKAIMESGTSKVSWFFQPYRGHAKEFYAQWSEKIGCPRAGKEQLECLRRADYWQVLGPPTGITVASPAYDKTGTSLNFFCGPVIDGAAAGLEGSPLSLVRRGYFNRVPLLIGGNKDDGRMFEEVIRNLLPNKNPFASLGAQLRSRVDHFFDPLQASRVEALYTDAEFRTLFGTVDYTTKLSRIIRDVVFACSDRALAEAWTMYAVPVWLYSFSFDLGLMDKILGIGDGHGLDILFVFRKFINIEEMAPHVPEMSDIITCKWTTFAHTADPNGKDPKALPPNCEGVHENFLPWPQYDRETQKYYSLRYPPAIGQLRTANIFPDDELPSLMKCNMWDRCSFPWPAAAGARNATQPPVVV